MTLHDWVQSLAGPGFLAVVLTLLQWYNANKLKDLTSKVDGAASQLKETNAALQTQLIAKIPTVTLVPQSAEINPDVPVTLHETPPKETP